MKSSKGSAIPNNIWMTYTWLVMVWETCCHICWYWEIWMSSGQIIIIHSPELLGHLGMNPLQKPWFPGLGRIGFGRDEIYPGIFVWFWDILCVYTGITPYILWNAWTYIYISIYYYILVGGFNLSEKYESQLGWLFPYIMVNKKCSKPPTSHYIHIFAI